MSCMETQATAARRPTATGLLQLFIILTHSYITEQINKDNGKDIFESVLPSRSVWFRYEEK